MSADITVATPAREQAAAVRAKEISARELLDLHLERIALRNPRLNAIVSLDEERARAGAEAADRALAAGAEPGPLHGLPFAFKDTHAVAGWRTTYGSPLFAEHVPDTDELLVERVRAAGAVTIGKTNVPEFAAGSHTLRLIQAPSGKCVEDESDDCRDCRFKCGVGPPVVCVENFPRFDMGDDSFDGGACVVEALVECFLPVEKFPAGWFFERGEHAAPDVSFIADRGGCGEVVEGAGLVEAI